MLKHQVIVDKLSETQKIQILADVRTLSLPEYAGLGVPEFKISYLEAYIHDSLPSPAAMANSWNFRAISMCAEETAVKMSESGINIVTLPSPVPKLNMTNKAVSEDPLVSSRVVSAYLAAMKNKGMGVVLDGAYLNERDVSKLDKRPSAKLVNEFVIRPLNASAATTPADGVIVGSSEIDVENYEHINSYILKSISDGDNSAFQTSKIICKDIPQEETVAKIVRGYICLDGSELVLKTSLDRYRRLKAGITEGRVSLCELEAEIENGTAFPPEEIDKAVDGVIDFIFEITSRFNGKMAANPLNYGIAKTLATESVVMLKNSEKLLPLKPALKKPGSIAFVGDILSNYSGANEPDYQIVNEIIGYANQQEIGVQKFLRGYSMANNRNEKLLVELDEALKNVSTVVLFMGLNPQREKSIEKTENLYLPANQIAVVDKLKRMGKKIIAVVSSSHAIDVTFVDSVDAFLLAPLNVKLGFHAIIDILAGKTSPSGKLAYSLYSDTDNSLMKQEYYLGLPQTKVSTFIGYRYYDSAKYDVAYPFGFGLSYSKFDYSGLSIQGRNVVFTVRNKGKVAAAEVPQVYVGMSKISAQHPKKQLVGFEKVFLQPGASTTVTIPISNIEIYDPVSGKWVFEKGQYTVYVGSSLTDIRLKTKVNFGIEVLSTPQTDLFNYLQSETNIFSDKYTLEADYKLMKKNVRNIAFGIGSLVLAISMFIFSLASGKVGIFFNVVAAILAFASAIFFILEGTDRKKLHEKTREEINKANKEYFSDADVIPSYSTASVFADEFDKAGKAMASEFSPVRKRAENYLEFVNESLTYELAAQQFTAFALSKGYKFETETVRTLFSAMSASRLIIMKGMTTDSFTLVIKLISEYFDTNMSIDMVDSSYVDDASALFKQYEGKKHKTALMNTLLLAKEENSKVFVTALSDVKFAELSNYFVPFARYIRNPRNAATISTVDENGRSIKVKFSENVWFFMSLNANETLSNVPAYISELASFVKIECAPAAQVALEEPIIPFTYYQFDYLLEGVKNKYGISEENWKKIDSVEAFVNTNVAYTIGNRTCIAVERFFAVYRACGGEEKNAIDRVLSARIIPSAIVALDTLEESEQKNLSEKLDSIFGEENIDISRAGIRSSGTSVL